MPSLHAKCAHPVSIGAGSLLLVEDDPELAALLHSTLQEIGCEVACADTVALARQRLYSREWDLVVLDSQLPDGDGFDLCSELRQGSSRTAVLMLTARASEADRIAGLERGADDYLAKPFSLRELVLRAGNLLKRRGRADAVTTVPARIVCGEIAVEIGPRRVHCRGSEIFLPPREFDLLVYLARHADRVFTRGQLLDAVWGARFEGYEHTVNSHINRLRARIETDPRQPRLLVTVWGSGYRLVGSAGASRIAR